MVRCYMCDESIEKSNSSLEHVIPNALGGSLKSRNLICRPCNSKVGLTEDAALVKQFELITNLLNIKRDRGKPQPIKVKVKDRLEEYKLLPGGKPEMIKPVIKIGNELDEKGKMNIEIKARDKKQAKHALNGSVKKYNISNHKIEEILKGLEVKEAFFKEHLTFNGKFGGEEPLRATAKILLNFYIYSGGNVEWVEDFIHKYLDKNYDILSRISFMYLDDEFLEKYGDEILHSILIIGDKRDGVLYGYVELFNAYRVLILLNDSYKGPDLDYSYFFDVENREKREKKHKLKLSKGEIKEYLKRTNEQYSTNLDRLIEEMNTLMEIIHSRLNSRLIDKIIKDSINKMDSRYPQADNPFITQEMISFLSSEVSEKYIMYFSDIDKPNI